MEVLTWLLFKYIYIVYLNTFLNINILFLVHKKLSVLVLAKKVTNRWRCSYAC